jgi:hypothetical protein
VPCRSLDLIDDAHNTQEDESQASAFEDLAPPRNKQADDIEIEQVGQVS